MKWLEDMIAHQRDCEKKRIEYGSDYEGKVILACVVGFLLVTGVWVSFMMYGFYVAPSSFEA
ncbi:hypothetical protein GOV10_04050, partial [Candidatus Woesearchaeota archaeon]|nr:hypothetical protein [Candidatus Woesearchaeota archaeon]